MNLTAILAVTFAASTASRIAAKILWLKLKPVFKPAKVETGERYGWDR